MRTLFKPYFGTCFFKHLVFRVVALTRYTCEVKSFGACYDLRAHITREEKCAPRAVRVVLYLVLFLGKTDFWTICGRRGRLCGTHTRSAAFLKYYTSPNR